MKWYNKSGKKQIPKQKGCTRRKVYETKLSSSDQLKPLGTLIKTIIHDFNNHWAAYYRHAIHDEVCPDKQWKMLADAFEYMDFDDDEIDVLLSLEMIPNEIKYPGFQK